MGLNVSYNQIDASTLKEVTAQIFNRASNSVLANADLTKFNRGSVDTDLYSRKVEVSTTRQIAMNKSNFQVSLSDNAVNSLKYLNTLASRKALKSIDEIETTNVEESKNVVNFPVFGKLTETEKKANPFYQEGFEDVNIFAA